MAKANVKDIDELHQFGDFLKRSEDEMMILIKRITSEVYRARDNWNDEVNQHFVDSIEPYIDQVIRLTQILGSYSKHVHMKASILDEYHRINNII